MLPLKAVSRLWGQVNSYELPVWMRKPLLNLYVWLFGCKLDEAAIRDLKHYRNLGEFFRRRLRPGSRPLDTHHCLVNWLDLLSCLFNCIFLCILSIQVFMASGAVFVYMYVYLFRSMQVYITH